jgi:predicted nucleic acid-binding protein
MSAIFIDTSFIVALHSTQEQRYAAAQSCWSGVAGQRIRVTTTTFVLDEVVTLLNSRGNHALAVAVGRQILESPAFGLIHIDDRLLSRGWDYFVRHEDKRYSLTDCISFVVMNERGLRRALTFDHHFAQAGFECVPD